MVNNRETLLVVFGTQMCLSNGKTNSVGNTLTQGTGGDFNTREIVLWMSSRSKNMSVKNAVRYKKLLRVETGIQMQNSGMMPEVWRGKTETDTRGNRICEYDVVNRIGRKRGICDTTR